MKWQAAIIDGKIFDLAHLHPFCFSLHLAAQRNLPAVTFEIDVTFGLHCFTEETKPGDCIALHYSDMRERRTFNFERYQFSLRLPEIIRTLATRRCYQGKYNNFMTFEIMRNGILVHYQVYFQVTKSRNMPGRLTLFVQSAYPKLVPQKIQREKPCLFKVICVQAANGSGKK